MCQDVSSAEESAFPAPTVLVKSGSVDAVPSRQAVSVLWNLFKIKSVVSYLLSWNRIVLVFIVTISKVRKGYRSLQRDRETPLGFQGSFDLIPLVCMHLICNIIGVMWALEMGKHWPSSGRAWHLWFLGIDFRGGWVMSPRLLTGDAGSWLPVLDFVEWLSGWLGGLLIILNRASLSGTSTQEESSPHRMGFGAGRFKRTIEWVCWALFWGLGPQGWTGLSRFFVL